MNYVINKYIKNILNTTICVPVNADKNNLANNKRVKFIKQEQEK